MKNHKQLLADFYLALLGSSTRFEYFDLKENVLCELAANLKEDVGTVRRIFERMAAEDAKV
jgi:hypothetical protein